MKGLFVFLITILLVFSFQLVYSDNGEYYENSDEGPEEFDANDPETWEKNQDWGQINQQQLSTADPAVVEKASVDQAETYFSDKIPPSRELNSNEWILMRKINPNLDESLSSVEGIKVGEKELEMPDGTKVNNFENSEGDIRYAKEGLMVGDLLVKSGEVTVNSDGSYTLEGEKGVTEVITPQGVYVMTMTEDTTLYTENAPDSCTQCVMVDDSEPEKNYVYMDGDGIAIKLDPGKTIDKKWQLDVGDSEGTSFVLDKNGDVALTINDGRPNQMPGVALGDTGFSEMNFETWYHWTIGDNGICSMEGCESSSSAPSTGLAIVDVIGYVSLKERLKSCVSVATSYAKEKISSMGYENLAKPDKDDCTGDGCTYNLRGEVVVRDEDGKEKRENGKVVLTPIKDMTNAVKTTVYLEQGKPEPGDFYIVGDQIYQVSDRLTSEGWKKVLIPIKKEERPTSSEVTSTFLHYDGKVYTYNTPEESVEPDKQTPNEKFEKSLPEHLKSGETSKLEGNGAKFLNYINYLKKNRIEYKSIEETKTTIVYEINGNKYFFTKDGRSLNTRDPPGWPGS